ncbi:MAG: translation initiation factor IF-3 [Deltaproteobacteria bacterium]|nr:translation initiation factor IF-3 [Deltaproteobacteria bacterium]
MQPRKPELRTNRRIRVPEVRLIGAEGEQLGVFQTADALKLAEDIGLDLVEISPTARPPVCKIMDVGKWKYEQAKKAHEARKHQFVALVKEIKLRPSTGVHDLEVKLKRIREFLTQGHKAKVTIQFRGREMAHKDLGQKMLQRVITGVAELGAPEQTPRFEGRFLSTVLQPMKQKSA